MALSAAERQPKRRAKLKTTGRVLFQAWVTPKQAERIKGRARRRCDISRARAVWVAAEEVSQV